tara:strand:+ start:5757 stop:6296 length:540 start_codon:yes stop_codon:yes gene_type:complete
MSDGINAIAIITIILILVGLLSITINIGKIKTNWKEYQCNPIFIPFSSIFSSKSASETFNVCISNYVKNFMNIFIEPFLNMFDVFINYGEIIFKFLDNFKTLANMFQFNIADFIEYFKTIITKVIDVLEGVMSGIEAALKQIQVLIDTLQESYISMLDGAEGLLNNSNLGTLITNLETL